MTRTRLNLFVNSQFDPLTNRQDFSSDKWNESLVPLVAELWAQATLDLFSEDPKATWQTMPVPGNSENLNASPFVQRLEDAIISIAREQVAAQLTFPVPEQGELGLSQLATEAKPLENILKDTETAKIAGLPATLPIEVRDQAGRWRQVLDDWRSAGANIPESVSVEQAINLLGDKTRTPKTTIALVAAGLDDGLDHLLSNLPCVIAQDGRHVIPPYKDSPEVLAASATPLAEQLGVVTLLHSAHRSDSAAAKTVFDWLRKTGALLEKPDDRLVVRRLADAGKAGREMETPLTDEQVLALRDAFERMDSTELKELGPHIGSAVSLQAFQYKAQGNKKSPNIRVTAARPVDAYLPNTVDRATDSFASAAKQSPGILWLSRHYANLLRSERSRQGIGAQRFLSLLGAETAPRPRLHPQLEQRFATPRRGLHAFEGPFGRSQALSARGATYTLEDYDCPDLSAVLQDISRLRRDKQARRRRAAALLAVLGRAWERLLGDVAEVEAAHDYYDWNPKDSTAAYWLWAARELAWLDDESGTPRRPDELRIRTNSTVAIYGENSPDYLHGDLNNQNWRTVLSAFGVHGDPTPAALVDRLKELRESSKEEGGITGEALKEEAAVVYKALASASQTPNRIRATPRADRDQNRLRQEFERGEGLVLSNCGWRPPQDVLRGPAIFGQYRAFAPAIADTDYLWVALGLRQHSFEDCMYVIGQITKKRGPLKPSDESVLLETLRALSSHVDANGVPQQARAKLRKLRLWTSLGWVRNRPVYTTDDLVLAEGLKDLIPLWQPGGEIEQFRSLLGPLRVEEVGATAEVIDPQLAIEDVEASDFFRLALRQLQDDLSRNEPELATGVRMPWEHLIGFSVHVHPSLRLRVTTGPDRAQILHECSVAAKVDQDCGVFYVQTPTDLPGVNAGGRAIATLFDGDPRRVAHAWLAACGQAESRRLAYVMELAEQRARMEQEQTDQSIEERTANFRDGIALNHRRPNQLRGRKETDEAIERTNRRADAANMPKLDPRRALVNPDLLELVDPLGNLEKHEPTSITESPENDLSLSLGLEQPARGEGRQYDEPRSATESPQGSASIRPYGDVARENVGMDLLRKVLSSDSEAVKDLRSQRGVGADAVDELKRFYELKVHAGPEPNQVSLTKAEAQRALNDPRFFLVVVSDVEGEDANPKVRIIVDPMRQLRQNVSGAVTLSGVRNATSLVYDFTRINGLMSDDQIG